MTRFRVIVGKKSRVVRAETRLQAIVMVCNALGVRYVDERITVRDAA